MRIKFPISYRRDIDGLKAINLNWDAGKIERHIRATMMPGFEPPYVTVNGEKIYLRRGSSQRND